MKFKFSERELEDAAIMYLQSKGMIPEDDYRIGFRWATTVNVRTKELGTISLELEVK